MLNPRTLQQVDDDLKESRDKLLDSVRDSDRWRMAWEYIDRLLDERHQITSKKQ